MVYQSLELKLKALWNRLATALMSFRYPRNTCSQLLPWKDMEVSWTHIYSMYIYRFYRPFTNIHQFPGFSGKDMHAQTVDTRLLSLIPHTLGIWLNWWHIVKKCVCGSLLTTLHSQPGPSVFSGSLLNTPYLAWSAVSVTVRFLSHLTFQSHCCLSVWSWQNISVEHHIYSSNLHVYRYH